MKFNRKRWLYLSALAVAALTPVVGSATEACIRTWTGYECSWNPCGEKFWKHKYRYVECDGEPDRKFIIEANVSCDCLTGS